MIAADPQRQASQRFYDLDALRALAMFLGIVLHTTLFVLPEPVALWPIFDENAAGDPTYRVVIDAIHGFRMPLFFLLSGFFSALLWQRRGLNALGMQRVKRVGVPLVVACLTVLPLSVWLLAWISGRQAPYDFSPWVLPLVWVLNLGHLWFLWYLLLITAGFIVAAVLGLQFRHPVIWWLLLPASMLISLIMIEPVFGADTAEGLAPEAAVIFYYACFFLFGVFFYQRGITVRRWWSAALLLAVAVFISAWYVLNRYLAEVECLPEAARCPPEDFLYQHPLTLVSALLQAVYAWLMCFGMMGLFRWIAARESFTVRYLSDATYWMYLAHAPLVVIGQWLVVDWPISYHLKFLLVCAGVTALVLVSYQYVVRYTFIGRTLNGPRTPRPST